MMSCAEAMFSEVVHAEAMLTVSHEVMHAGEMQAVSEAMMLAVAVLAVRRDSNVD